MATQISVKDFIYNFMKYRPQEPSCYTRTQFDDVWQVFMANAPKKSVFKIIPLRRLRAVPLGMLRANVNIKET
jgi:hypothetical protein